MINNLRNRNRRGSRKQFRSNFLYEHNEHIDRRFKGYANEGLKNKYQFYSFTFSVGKFTRIDDIYSTYEKKSRKHLLKGENILIEGLIGGGAWLITYDRKKDELVAYKVLIGFNYEKKVEIDLDSNIIFSEKNISYYEEHNYQHNLTDDDYYPDMIDKLFYLTLYNLWG